MTTTKSPTEVLFGKELRLARVRFGARQKDVADHMGWHTTSISQMELGNRATVPPADVVAKLDRYLGAGGALLAAAGYQRSPKTGKLTMTYDLPAHFTNAERRMVLDFIDFLGRGK